jgi:ATP-dependent DNA ligase
MAGKATGPFAHVAVKPPVKPMLCKSVTSLPMPSQFPGGLTYEPKWDGFRCIAFRDGDDIELGSRNERPMTRYFPELVEALRANTPDRCVLDGEIVVPSAGGRLDFPALQQRIHPAESRVRRLAEETPASYVAFDLLALDEEDLRKSPLSRRRELLVESLSAAKPPVYLTPSTESPATARDWFARFEGAGLDGVIAKPMDAPYREDQRALFKVKHSRTADVVVAGFRWHKSGPVVGSLLLGLYNTAGNLQHIGVAAAFTMARRRELVDELAPLRENALDGHPWADWATAAAESNRMPGAVSRWNAKKDLSWEPLRIERVCEISYDQLEGDRLRHTGQFKHWRPDRDPRSCTYEQLDEVTPEELKNLFAE